MSLLFKKIWQHKFVFLLINLLMLGMGIANIMIPKFMSNMINGVISKDSNALLLFGSLMLGMAIIWGIINILASNFSAELSSKICMELRGELFDKIISLDAKGINNYSTSSLLSRTTKDLNQVQNFLSFGLKFIIYTPILSIVALISLYMVNGLIFILIILAIVIFLIVMLFIFKKLAPLNKSIKKMDDLFNLIIGENLSGIQIIRSFNRQNFETNRFNKATEKTAKLDYKVFYLYDFYFSFAFLMTFLVPTAIIYLSAYLIVGGAISPGDILASLQYTNLLFGSFFMITQIIFGLPVSLISLDRIDEVLKDPNIVKNYQAKDSIQNIESIEFKNINFSYQNSEENILTDINLKIENNQKIGIVGATGSGKSTLVKLLLRLIDPSSGEILINGIDYKNISLENLYNLISYTSQKSILFQGTIESNLDFATNQNKDKYQEYLKMANLDKALNESVSEAGSNLSGGQRQRLAIARSLLKEADVLIFDDTFSALDAKTDAQIRENINYYYRDKHNIMIIISQKIKSIIDCDKIVVMNDGKLVACGTHSELMKISDFYQEIVDIQMKEEIHES